MTLRRGLKFSNGTPVMASDFTYAVERALKIPWGGSSFITANIVGAQRLRHRQGQDDLRDHDQRRDRPDHDPPDRRRTARSTTCSRSRRSAPVPDGHADEERADQPARRASGRTRSRTSSRTSSYSVVKNPYWTPIPGIPSGSREPDQREDLVEHDRERAVGAEQLGRHLRLGRHDPAGVLLPRSRARRRAATARSCRRPTYYFFLNSKTKPFSSQLAREAVVVGLDRNALARLGSGNFIPGCYFLPPAMVGHPTQPCPYGDPAGAATWPRPRRWSSSPGWPGTPVTVWGEERSPRRQCIDYYTSFLNQIGFKATEKIIADATYFPTIGNLKLNPQTGFADWNQDFPNPIDFYGILLPATRSRRRTTRTSARSTTRTSTRRSTRSARCTRCRPRS